MRKVKLVKGSVLIQVTVLSGVLLLGALGVLSFSKLAMQQSGTGMRRLKFENLLGSVQQILQDPHSCSANFASLGSFPGNVKVNALNQRDQNGNVVSTLIFNNPTLKYQGWDQLTALFIVRHSGYDAFSGVQALTVSARDIATSKTYSGEIPIYMNLQGPPFWPNFFMNGGQLPPLSGPVTILGCGTQTIVSSKCYSVTRVTPIPPSTSNLGVVNCNSSSDIPVSGGGICGMVNSSSTIWNNIVNASTIGTAVGVGVATGVALAMAGAMAGLAVTGVGVIVIGALILFSLSTNAGRPLEYGKFLSLSQPTSGGWLIGCQFAHSDMTDAVKVENVAPVAGWAYCCKP